VSSVYDPFDPGLQPERNELAWQRTGLILAGTALVVGRLTLDSVGPLAAVVMLLGFGHAAVIFVTAREEYRFRRRRNSRSRWPTAVHGAFLVVQVVILGALTLVDLARGG
jgi:uncharacterized membrane protein YidH (DUF202 family)